MSKKDSLITFSRGVPAENTRVGRGNGSALVAGRNVPEHAMLIARAAAKRAIERKPQPMKAEQIKALFRKT